jgi:diguanylate cyclase (GGDEF)-like protein
MFPFPFAMWPIIAAMVFGGYSVTLLWNSVQAQQALRIEVDARLTVDSQRRAAIVGALLTEFHNDVAYLAAAHEIQTYVINKSLGMSLRYGLEANLASIAAGFRRAIKERAPLGTNSNYDRVIFFDEDRSVLVDVSRTGDKHDAMIPDPAGPALAFDFHRGLIVQAEPVIFKGIPSGRVMAMSSLYRLAMNLIDTGADASYREAVVTTQGQELPQSDGVPHLSVAEARLLAAIPENRVVPFGTTGTHGGRVAIRTPVKDAPLSLVTVMNQDAVYGNKVSGHFLAILGAIPVLVLAAGYGIEVQRRRSFFFRGLAHHDRLTGLPNRALLIERLQRAIARVRRSGGKGAVLFIDLDRFKAVNDSQGHAAGDELLKAVAARLQARLRTTDTLARHGGDEFVAVLENIHTGEDASVVARELIDLLETPFELSGRHTVHIGGSIGISLFPDHGTDADQLIERADTALYCAKNEGRGAFRYYTETLTAHAKARIDLEAGLRRALAEDSLVVHYQPLVSLARGAVIGVEALVRLKSPDDALVFPDAFIPLAEETGIVVALGERVLRMACAQMRAWLASGLPLHTVAVNVSPKQFKNPALLDRVRDILAETGLPPRHLELEITETAIMEGGDESIRLMRDIKSLGVRLAIDDFGTGHSSLSYLRRFPVDKLKIDRMFMNDLKDTSGRGIVRAIIGMARNLGLEILAEGVETKVQLDFLRRARCDVAQGYLFSRPVPADRMPELMDACRLEAFGPIPPIVFQRGKWAGAGLGLVAIPTPTGP